MPQVLVRGLSAAVLARLKARARRHGRSLQAELKTILDLAADRDVLDARVVADRIRRSFDGRRRSDSGSAQAEDRRR
ncbi:MAG: plasmid stabilization protein [Planctomycetia bacterium]|nr:plasmid stabilization protein [Planctomycetia bacterium]